MATTLENIQNGELCLANGVTKYEGRVEVYRNSEWTLLCNDGWDELDARVVCRQLNYIFTSIQVKSILLYFRISIVIIINYNMI